MSERERPRLSRWRLTISRPFESANQVPFDCRAELKRSTYSAQQSCQVTNCHIMPFSKPVRIPVRLILKLLVLLVACMNLARSRQVPALFLSCQSVPLDRPLLLDTLPSESGLLSIQLHTGARTGTQAEGHRTSSRLQASSIDRRSSLQCNV